MEKVKAIHGSIDEGVKLKNEYILRFSHSRAHDGRVHEKIGDRREGTRVHT